MALPAPAAGSRGLLSFRLLGFPVDVHASFLVVVALFGLSAGGGPSFALVWLVVATVSVIAHELGHALVAAPVGGEPRIDLYGLAGLTTWRPGRASRARRVAVSLAGPAAGMAFGIAVLFAYRAVHPEPGTLLDNGFRAAVFVNVFWGLLNLLPILPLDGGQVVLALMPGDDRVRLRRTAYLSAGAAAVVAVLAFAAGQPIAAVIVLYIAMGNVQTIRSLRSAQRDPFGDRLNAAEAAIADGRPEDALRDLPERGHAPAGWGPAVALLRAMALLRLDRPRDAQDVLLEGLPEGTRIDPTFEAAVLLANGQDRLARERLDMSLKARPPLWAVRELVALLARRGEDFDALLGHLTGEGAAGMLYGLYGAGRYADAARWGARAIETGGDPDVAYTTARARARSGDASGALDALDVAARLGFDRADEVRRDAALAPVRDLPGFAEVLQLIADNAGLGASAPHR